jgi:hypothetical protein
VLIYTACTLKRPLIPRSIGLVCISIFLLLTAHTNSSAHEQNSKAPFLINAAFENSTSANSHNAGSISADGTNTGTKINVADTENRKPDWDGVLWDTSIIFGGQIAAVAITYVMPESFSGWSSDQKNAGVKKYGENFTHPVLDKDKFYVNYVLHPYWGATYYIRGRERGLDQTYSFLYSTLLSAMYEFGTECIAERPSIQDLIVTPVFGSLLGAYIFEPWRELIKSKPELSWYDHTILALTDPLGLISLGFEKLFGVKTTIIVNIPTPQIQNRSTAIANNFFGATIQFPLN